LFATIFHLSSKSAYALDPCCDSGFVPIGEQCYPDGALMSVTTMVEMSANLYCAIEPIPGCPSKKLFIKIFGGIIKTILGQDVIDEQKAATMLCNVSIVGIKLDQEFKDQCLPLATAFFTANPGKYDNNCKENEVCFIDSYYPQGVCTIPKFNFCLQINDVDKRDKCFECFNQSPSGVWTAVGCIPTDPVDIIQTLLKIGLMLGGGVSLLIILAGSFMLSTSEGDPKKTSEAKEMITAAIIGLIFIIFSVSILQLIGVQILHIPGFGI